MEYKVMSGILEAILANQQATLAQLDAIRTALVALGAGGAGGLHPANTPAAQPVVAQTAAAALAATPAATAAAADPLAMGGAVQQTTSLPVTDQMIMDLITPHLNGPNAAAIKPKMQEVLAAMGINGLPAAQPHQYAELYQRFQQVIASMGAGQQAAPAATGII